MNDIRDTKINKKVFIAILWYTLVTASIIIFIDVINLFRVITTWQLVNISFFIFSLIIESICVIQAIILIRNKPNKISYLFITVYWISQTLIFGFKGNTYCFTTGPAIMIYFKYGGNFEWDYLFRFWSQEISINFNTISDRIYIGLNLIPIFISVLLICFRKHFKYSVLPLSDNLGS
jgi:hypothetical protein